MTTIKAALRRRFWYRALLLFGFILLILVLDYFNSPQFSSVIHALTPPQLPPLQQASQRNWPKQNWSQEIKQQYHHLSQGTRTLPIPLSWFLALERPAASPFRLAFGNQGRFADNEYLLRFGFIEDALSPENPHGLPLGFATTASQNLLGLEDKVTAVGFTCAACHTGHFIHADTEYIIEGGPATTDLGQFTNALAAALGQTLLSAKLPLLHGRFQRFARAVLGPDAELPQNVVQLSSQLESLVSKLQELPSSVAVVEGFTRLDALNRIGNQVFALDTQRFENYVAINAPVNYPHIWNASWFKWVQYDGSIMNPLVRNTGEALGVSAYLNTDASAVDRRFNSSADLNSLYWIEKALAGDNPLPDRAFKGLLSPPWPETLPAIDTRLVTQGSSLYAKHCQACHLPDPGSNEFWDHFEPIVYEDDGIEERTEESFLDLHIIPLTQIGTDAAQAEVLLTRTVNSIGSVDTHGMQDSDSMGITIRVCTNSPRVLTDPYAPASSPYASDSTYHPVSLIRVPIEDGPSISFALALGGVVELANRAWFKQNYISTEAQREYRSDRPNCLQAGQGYKARPLNGVWATAPFLHNGSVPTVLDLLSPPAERPGLVLLGGLGFDPVKLGLTQDPALIAQIKDGEKYNREGFFVLDTRVPGNHNLGHEFSQRYDTSKAWWQQATGVIGPELSLEERLAIIEYLKTL